MNLKQNIQWKILGSFKIILCNLSFNVLYAECNSKNETDFSVFYKKDELIKIELLHKKQTEFKNYKKVHSKVDQIHLQSLLYINSQNWVIWINSTMIEAQKPNSMLNLKILNVTKKNITLKWLDQNYEQRFTLYPHQCYRLKDKKILERCSA